MKKISLLLAIVIILSTCLFSCAKEPEIIFNEVHSGHQRDYDLSQIFNQHFTKPTLKQLEERYCIDLSFIDNENVGRYDQAYKYNEDEYGNDTEALGVTAGGVCFQWRDYDVIDKELLEEFGDPYFFIYMAHSKEDARSLEFECTDPQTSTVAGKELVLYSLRYPGDPPYPEMPVLYTEFKLNHHAYVSVFCIDTVYQDEFIMILEKLILANQE